MSYSVLLTILQIYPSLSQSVCNSLVDSDAHTHTLSPSHSAIYTHTLSLCLALILSYTHTLSLWLSLYLSLLSCLSASPLSLSFYHCLSASLTHTAFLRLSPLIYLSISLSLSLSFPLFLSDKHSSSLFFIFSPFYSLGWQ